MSLDRDQDVVTEDVEEDNMPPLVDNTNPNYTFFSGMTPLSFTSTSVPTASQDSSPQPSRSLISSLPASPITPDESTSSFSVPMSQPRPHGKRRDPSYIPRPPNAFILFRCAFIKEQNVPGKVEGNHSRLSKIIGLCWKQLTPEEREKWEAKAVLAQAEHRAHYPDWRFRPGANALAKLKIQDGTGPVTARRRSVRSHTAKDQPNTEDGEVDDLAMGDKGKAKEKGKGKAKSSRMLSLEETRCAKIAGFVAEGIKGQELEVAVKEWEGDHKVPKTNPRVVKTKGRTSQASSTSSSRAKSRSISGAQLSAKQAPDKSPELPPSIQSSWTPNLDPAQPNASENPAQSKTSSADSVTGAILSNVPLTHMFKRALSAPVLNVRPSYQQLSDRSNPSSGDVSPSSAEPSSSQWGSFKPPVSQEAPTRIHTHARRDTISLPTQSGSAAEIQTLDPPHHLTWQEAENQRRLEELQGPESWWSRRSPPASPQLAYPVINQQEGVSARLTTEGMGYGASCRENHFDRGYLERLGPYNHVQDGNQRVEWTNLAPASDRQGLVTVIEDPYKDDCNIGTASSNPTPTLSLPPISNSSYYHSPISPQTPTSFPSSSFSTLTGWAGDYKYTNSDAKTWPSDNTLNHSSPSWYSNEAALAWGPGRPELHRPQLAMDPEDWDRIENRAASDLHLQVEPSPRPLDFVGELRRAQGGTA